MTSSSCGPNSSSIIIIIIIITTTGLCRIITTSWSSCFSCRWRLRLRWKCLIIIIISSNCSIQVGQILLASEITVCIGILLSFQITRHYSVPQYVSSALITFVSAEVLEGVNLSLLSRVMSSRLARGTYNGGLLSTEAGTLARVVADATITLAGYLGEDKLLNVTLLPSFLICVASIAATCFTYNSLF
ncbi:hypothetical protein Taro_044396 [Colocasia esculenta]|uniref:Uncharacterized protein n=1 Tax=Colocasia esculenta TaxID=4460 RepID=A0A843WNL7_COLES|nr:hypothetical protein [Colocasia esculenta]